MVKTKFLRNIFIVSCIIVVILPLYNIFFAYPSFIKLLTENIENEAVRAGQHLSAMVISLEDAELTYDSINMDFLESTEKIIEDFNLMKLKVFSKTGEVLYSTDSFDIGDINKKRYFHNNVARGNIFTKIVQKGKKSLEDQEVIVDVVETYIPIMNGEIFLGAFEIYFDITDAKANIDNQLMESELIQLFVASGFLLTVILVLLRARRTINERERAEKQIQNYKNQLQVLINRLTTVEEQERKRISEELHDNIGQFLAISKIKVSKLRSEQPLISEDLDEIRKYIDQTIEFTRSLTFELSSPILYQIGFEQALEWLTDQIQEKHNILIDFVTDKKLRNFKGKISVQLYKTVRELLLNVVKHAEARKAAISVGFEGKNVHISIEDDGKGFDIEKVDSYTYEGKHFGIFSIRERISFLGGTFEIESHKGQGTAIKIIVPILHESGESLMMDRDF